MYIFESDFLIFHIFVKKTVYYQASMEYELHKKLCKGMMELQHLLIFQVPLLTDRVPVQMSLFC